MKRRTTFATILICTILVLVPASISSAAPPPMHTAVADTGLVHLGPGQTLSLIMANTEGDFHVRFRRMVYQSSSQDSFGVARNTMISQSTSAPMILDANEGASITVAAGDVNGDGVRVKVLMSTTRVSALQHARIVASIRNANGDVAGFFDVFTDLSDL
jgi:hypothetical protein